MVKDFKLSDKQRETVVRYVGFLIQDLVFKDDNNVKKCIEWLYEEVK